MSEAAAPAAAPAAPAPAPAPESLVHGAPTPAPAPAAGAPAPAATDEFTFAEKVLAKNADGAPDWEATAKNAEKARQHLEKRLGVGDTPPPSPAEYAFKMPEGMETFEFKPERFDAFKAEAHKRGVTAAQFEWMMGSYLQAVPDLMEGAAKLSANEARAELAKIWADPRQMDEGLQNATRAIRALPDDLQQATVEYGTNPVFLRMAAHFGAQMREDRPPASVAAPANVDVAALQRSEAYTNPRHPDHARVSKQVADHFARVGGSAPI